MSENLNNALNVKFIDIYSIMEFYGPYIRNCDEDYFTKFEELKKKHSQKDIVLIEDRRKNSKGEYGVFSWTTYTNVADSIAKFLLINTGFIEDCGRVAVMRYDAPYTYFDFDDEHDHEYDLAKILKDYFSRELGLIVFGCNYVFSGNESRVKIDDDNAIVRTCEFGRIYNELLHSFVEYNFTGNTYNRSVYIE